MKFNKEKLLLYAVTDRRGLNGKTLEEAVEDALKGGVTFVQLREKELSKEQVLENAASIKEICRKYGVPFVLDDDVKVAKAVGADGVHLGQNDMEIEKARAILGKDAIIGASARTVLQAEKAEREGADYLGVGAVFGTSTKSDAKKIDPEVLKDICESVDIPVIAIGGVSEENIDQLRGSGVCGVATVSAIFSADNIEEASRRLKKKTVKLFKEKMPSALTIAGSDSSGGAGIQADIKTMIANGVFATSAISALTAQNTTGVTGIMEVSPEFVKKQIDAVFSDIRPDAVKTGMISSKELIEVISERLRFYKAKNIVVDPVMVATSGTRLVSDKAVESMKKDLFSIATLITPNIPEAEIFSGMDIKDEEDMLKAAKKIYNEVGCAVLLKGGHQVNDANDLLVHKGGTRWFRSGRIDNDNTHGTGCTLSSAIASNLAKGKSLETAVQEGKNYISEALSAMLDLGKGSGPLDHGVRIDGDFSYID